jgi:DNA-binding transcriptional ArsR family regulator
MKNRQMERLCAPPASSHKTPDPSAIPELEKKAAEAAQLVELLANDQRLKVLCRLTGGEMTVARPSEYVSLTRSALSQHLGRLRAEGLLATRRDAQTIDHRLPDPIAERLIGVRYNLYGGPDH